jgi:hypothetical protein
MSNSVIGAARVRHRPGAVWALVLVLAFLGLSAAAGGVAMLSGFAPPDSWLDAIPVVGSWVVPGLVLGVGFGAGALLTAYGMVRRTSPSWLSPLERLTGHHWSWAASLLLGAGQLVWILLELVYLPEYSALQAVYGGTGAVLVLLPLLPPVRRDLTRAAS